MGSIWTTPRPLSPVGDYARTLQRERRAAAQAKRKRSFGEVAAVVIVFVGAAALGARATTPSAELARIHHAQSAMAHTCALRHLSPVVEIDQGGEIIGKCLP